MVEGKFINGDRLIIQASIAWGQIIQSPYFLLDTGFTGDLVVPPEVARDLGITLDGVTIMKMADNKTVPVKSGVAYGVMEGKTLYIKVLVSEGIPMLGISFLELFQYVAIVDCKNKKVSLEVADTIY
jgi:predicted aspartyl protease